MRADAAEQFDPLAPGIAQRLGVRGQRRRGPQHVAEMRLQQLRAAAGDIDELADQVAVHAGDEVGQVEVQVVDAAGGLAREVVAQRIRCQAHVQVGAGHDEGAARLGHLGPVHGQVAVDVQARGRAQAGAVQHRRPEQAMEVDDVLADEVVQFGVAASPEDGIEVRAVLRAQGAEAGQVADRCVQPHVEVLARLAGDLEPEVRGIARDVPRAQAAVGVQPLHQLGLHPGQRHVAGQPLAQEALEAPDLEEEVLGVAHLRGGPGQHRLRLLQVGRRVGGAADLAVVAVLVRRPAIGADALDVAVGQEHALGRVVELGHVAPRDVAAGLEARVELLGQFAVRGGVGRVVMVERHAERGEVALMAGLHAGDEGFGRDPGLLGGEHDRRAMGVVGAHVVHRVPAHAPRPHPDVGLDVADQVAQVQRAIGVGQGVGDERRAGHGGHDARGRGLSHAAGAGPAAAGDARAHAPGKATTRPKPGRRHAWRGGITAAARSATCR